MVTEKEVTAAVKEVVKDYKHVLGCGPASTAINAPRALMQLSALTKLSMLYWFIGKERPEFKCDDQSKLDT